VRDYCAEPCPHPGRGRMRTLEKTRPNRHVRNVAQAKVQPLGAPLPKIALNLPLRHNPAHQPLPPRNAPRGRGRTNAPHVAATTPLTSRCHGYSLGRFQSRQSMSLQQPRSRAAATCAPVSQAYAPLESRCSNPAHEPLPRAGADRLRFAVRGRCNNPAHEPLPQLRRQLVSRLGLPGIMRS
jgi:hypothetical protein